MHRLELRIPPLLLLALFAAAMAGVTHALPSASIDIPARLATAGVLGALGGAVAIAGVVAFRGHGTTVNPFTPNESSSLVTTGIYRISRNPMYLGVLLVLAGWWVYLANVAAALLLPAFVAYLNRFQIEPEERALSRKFGDRFSRYASAVRRWL